MRLFQWLASGTVRTNRLAAALLLAITLGMIWTPAHASFPATSDPAVCTVAPCYVYRSDGTTPAIPFAARYPSASALCNDYVSRANAGTPTTTVALETCEDDSTPRLRTFNTFPGGSYLDTYKSFARESAPPSAPVYSCPEKSKLYGSTCSCEAGYVDTEVANTCVAAPPLPEVCPADLPLPDGTEVGHPIIPATGEKVLNHSDHAGSGPDALSLARSYRSSRMTGVTGAATAGLGQTWSHNHSVFLKQEGTAGGADSKARILLGSGSIRAFSWDSTNNSWKPTNSADTLTANTTGLLYKRLDDDSLWQFDATGKLLTVTQRNGWVTTYTYSIANTPATVAPMPGLLITVSNQFGRTLNFRYNGASQLVKVTASNGQVIRYGYDGTSTASRLTTVSYPGNVSGTVNRIYHYENTTFTQLLTGITDELGNRYETLSYDSLGRGISTQLAGGADLYTVSYGTAGSATVTDPLGTQRTYNYSTTKGKLVVTGADKPSGTGNSSAASRVQDTNGFLTQETDFLGVNTMYTWDINRRLPLTVTKAAALPEVQTTTTQWHATLRLPVLVTEAGRTTAYTYDSAGNMLTRTITDTATSVSRTTTWTYNAQGQPLTETPPNGVAANTYAYYSNTAGFVDTTVASDPYFDYVSLLLRADGANGAVTFTDSSAIPKPVTVVGNAVISTAQSKFGGSSMYFNGGAGHLSIPYSQSFDMGLSDFTAETWYYATTNTTDQALLTIAKPSYASVNDFGLAIHHFGTSSSYPGKVFAFIYSGLNYYGVQSVGAIAVNTWHHIAFVRKSGVLSLYLNGVSQGTANGNFPVNTSASGWAVSVGRHSVDAPRYVNGYLDDFRFTNGVARYTANFTPPTTAFPNAGPVVDPNAVGHTAGDLQSITNAAGKVTQFSLYDRAGRVRQMVDPKGVVTDTTYTPRGWISSVTVTPPGGIARTTTYTYDNAGQLTTVILPDTTTMSYSYDTAHRLTGVTDTKGNSVIYTLDAMGNRTGEQVKDPSGTLQRNITRVYDALNRVQQVTGAGN